MQLSLTGLDYQKRLSWYSFHEEHGFRNASNVFPLFKTVVKVFKAFKVFAPCLKNEVGNQLKDNFIYWKATRVSPDYTQSLAVCAHFERHLPPSLWTMVLQTSESVISICNKLFLRKAYSKGVINITMVRYYR